MFVLCLILAAGPAQGVGSSAMATKGDVTEWQLEIAQRRASGELKAWIDCSLMKIRARRQLNRLEMIRADYDAGNHGRASKALRRLIDVSHRKPAYDHGHFPEAWYWCEQICYDDFREAAGTMNGIYEDRERLRQRVVALAGEF